MKKKLSIAIIGLAVLVLAVALMGSGIQQTAYSLIKNAGSALTRRQTINCGTNLTCTDDAGNNWTNIAASGGGGGNPTISVSNAASTGTTTSTLTKLTGAPSTAVIAGTSDTGGVVGITTSGAGTTGSATITIAGSVSCVFDGSTTAGHYVQISSMTAGNCTDAGATYPSSNQVMGRVLSTNVGSGTYTMDLFPSEIVGAGGGGGGGYTTIQNLGSSLTSRATVNFRNGLGCNDSGSITQCTGYLGIVPPTVAASTWVNQASATTTESGGLVYMQDVAAESGLHMLCQSASPPYTVSANFRYLLGVVSGKYPAASFGFRDSSSGKLEVISLLNNAGAGLTLAQYYEVDQWTNATTLSGALLAAKEVQPGQIIGLQVADDGTTNKTWSYSIDGVIYNAVQTEGRTTFLTANQVCWGVFTNNSAGQLSSMTLTSWYAH